jgi:predicted Fe-Mo cluster-binding NifX family protein
MKICIPTLSDLGVDAEMSEHFGSAPYFTIVDTEGDGVEVVRNSGLGEGPHSDHHVGALTARDVDAVVCNGVGRRAFAALHQAGIDVFSPSGKTVGGAVEAVRDGSATPLTEDQACGGGRREGRGHRGGSHGCQGRGRRRAIDGSA